MRASERIAELERVRDYLTNRCNHLERELSAALGAGARRVKHGLTPQASELVEYLRRAYPAPRSPSLILEALTPRDHAQERDISAIAVRVKSIREKCGVDCIDTVRNRGYRLSDDFAAKLKAEA